jgi:hydroxypyruvate reductase
LLIRIVQLQLMMKRTFMKVRMTCSDKPAIIELLLRLYQAALDAADPMKVVPPYLPPLPRGRTVVIGVGKAAAAMAKVVEANWSGELTGVVVVPDNAGLPLQRIQICEGSHPVPDERSIVAATKLLKAVEGLTADDLVIALISGGGSALCCLPAAGLTLADKQNITRKLLKCGATITEINTVRRHLSAIKGGRLAAHAYPAQVVTLMISDIPGDEPSLIASGPTLADATTCSDALQILSRYSITDMPAVSEALSSGTWESIKPDDSRLTRNTQHIISSAWNGMQAAAKQATLENIDCHILSDAMEGEARDLAKAHAAIALSIARHNVPFKAPCVVISGGEATVTVRGEGRGGRNTEFILAMAMALEGQAESGRIFALSAGTDGLDGKAQAAGAWMDHTTLHKARAQGLSPQDFLDSNDSATLLDTIGTLVHTGPTFTNINDFRGILIQAK